MRSVLVTFSNVTAFDRQELFTQYNRVLVPFKQVKSLLQFFYQLKNEKTRFFKVF